MTRTTVSPTSQSIAGLQMSLRGRAGTQGGLDWPTELVAAAPHGGGAAATVHADHVVVVAAHSGAGASTVALAMADAAAAAGHAVHLVEMSEPMRSGLVGVSHAELGVLPTGDWYRGRRDTSLLVDRRTVLGGSSGKRTQPVDGAITIVDLGLPTWGQVAGLGVNDGGRLVIVGRATVPGVRSTEQTVAELDGAVAAVAMIGPERWPGEVRSGMGPELRAVADAGALVPMPHSRRLEACGLDQRALPSSALKAGHALNALCAGVTA